MASSEHVRLSGAQAGNSWLLQVIPVVVGLSAFGIYATLRAFEGIIAIEPGRELALRAAGRVLTDLKRPVLAREMLQKAIAVDPWQSDYHRALAMVCGQMEDWSAAIAACREALSKNPELLDARSLLVQCYLRAGETKKADAEFQVMLRLFPASREAWQKWYEPQKLASPP